MATDDDIALTPDEATIVERARRQLDPHDADDTERRIFAGRTLYGPLELRTDKRDWLAELREEAIDAWVYAQALDTLPRCEISHTIACLLRQIAAWQGRRDQ